MRTLCLFLLLSACGPKKAPETAAATPAPAPPPVEAAPEPEPEPEAEAPKDITNADLNITVGHADGSSKAGHVKRIERSADWFGETTWSTDPADLKVSLEKGSVAKDVTWEEIKSIVVTPGQVTDADCDYDSNWTPWMYECVLKTTGAATLKDGTTGWTVSDRHKWRFTYNDDSTAEVWLHKYPAREQDAKVQDLDSTSLENTDLYVKLQARLRTELKTTFVTKVTVQ